MDPGAEERRWRELAAGERVARLATIRPDGAIVDLVPITFAFVAHRLVFAVDHKPKSTTHLQRLRNIAAHPDVTVLFDRYDDKDWSQLWWVRMRGRAEMISDTVVADRALDALVGRYRQYADRRPSGPVVQIEPVEWRGWSGGTRLP